MMCEKCRAEGKKSKVYIGAQTSTLMAPPPAYYDENGRLVVPPDPNVYTTEYRCSNGHEWTVSGTRP
jgi:hypothetical protein